MDFEKYVEVFFEAAKLKARKIPESNEKTPDFIITDDVNILVELKEKQDDQKDYNKRESTFANDEIFEHVQKLGYRNRLSGIIGSAAKQLEAQKEKTNSKFCFVFIVMTGISPNAQISQFSSTLYGKKNILNTTPEGSGYMECYYFTYSDFHKYADIIDGVFLVKSGYLELLINDKSPRYNDVINSRFVNRFQGYITDPIELQRKNEILYVDSDISRKDEDSVKDYILKKYGIEKGFAFDFPHFSLQGRISVDDI